MVVMVKGTSGGVNGTEDKAASGSGSRTTRSMTAM